MKIAVFHNYMDNIGGAERVGLTLARELNADIYTTNVDHSKIKKMGFGDIPVISIGEIPLNAPERQQMAAWRFRNLNLKNKYDFYIIDGDWALSGVVNNKPNMWYVHSPIREIWDLYQQTRVQIPGWHMRLAFDAWVYYNRFLNLRYVNHATCLTCNSANTQSRVRRFLHKDATVIHPPTETKKFYFNKSGDYWLAVNRLIGHKRVEMQLEAFRRLPNERLVIVGSYEKSRHFQEYVAYVESIKPSNVEILNWVSEEKLIELYADCKGFITTAIDEDFGMTPVEAMAAGKPVIAPYEGGYRETVVDNVTGQFLEQMTVENLVRAINIVGRDPLLYKEACMKRAQDFDVAVFIKKIRAEIEKTLTKI